MNDDMLLPFGWLKAQLKEIYRLEYGKALPDRERDTTGHIPVVGSSGIVGRHSNAYARGPAIVVGRKGAAGSVNFIASDFWPIDTTYFVQPPSGVDPKFAYYQLQSLRLQQLEKSTAVPGLSRDDAYALSLALPPAPEQRRIVAKIEELFSKIDKGIESLTTAREQLKAYRQSILKSAFANRLTSDRQKDKGKNRWTSITINEASAKIVDCLHSTPQFSASGKYCIDSTWVEDNKVLHSQARFVDEEVYRERIQRLKPQRGDVLFVREGSKKIGTALVVNFDDDICLGQRMMMFRLHQKILPHYFVYYIQSNRFKAQYKPLIGGSASPHLNISEIKKMTIPLCAYEEQLAIVKRLDAQFYLIEESERIFQTEMIQAEALRQSILKRAFSGQLVPQDPNDEPASVLLDRIRAEHGKAQAPKNRPSRTTGKTAA